MDEHVDYPHEPGTLYDCPACEASGELDSQPTNVVFVEIIDLDAVVESLTRFLIANGNDDTVAIVL